jgi:heterodisulfide reductase subunit B
MWTCKFREVSRSHSTFYAGLRNMKYAFYLGCWIKTELYNIELSTRQVLPKFGIELLDIEGFSCCGYPMRSYNQNIMVYMSARNIAIAESAGLDLFPLCNGCHASICEVKHAIDNNPELKHKINETLEIEGLKYEGKSRVVHIIDILHKDIGEKSISESIIYNLKNIKLAPHYGCHAFRPSVVGRPEDPETPHILDGLINAIGGYTPYYPEKLDCCGSSLGVAEIDTALDVAGTKLKAIHARGYEGIVTICAFCHKMLDTRQEVIKRVIKREDIVLPVFYYTQLLGLAMGIDARKLGLHLNQSQVDHLIAKILGG